MPTLISPEYTRGDLIAMIHSRDELVSDLKETCEALRIQVERMTVALKVAEAFLNAEHDHSTHLGRSVSGSNRDLAEAVSRGERYKDTKKAAQRAFKAFPSDERHGT